MVPSTLSPLMVVVALLWPCESALNALGSVERLPPSGASSSVPGTQSAEAALRVRDVRLEAAPDDVPRPSSVLKFDLLNQSVARITDVMLEVVIVKRSQQVNRSSDQRVVGPFSIRGNVTIEAGYSISYVILLRNLSPECECVPDVSVVSARQVSQTKEK